MIRIGLLPSSELIHEDPYKNKYKTYNVYLRPLVKCGFDPLSLLPVDGIIPESTLEVCDAFLLCGGDKVETPAFQIIKYAIEHNKPLLGVCLGCQTLGIYTILEDRLKQANMEITVENLNNMYKTIKEEKVMFLKPVNGHYNKIITMTDYEEDLHIIKIDPTSKIYDIFQTETPEVLSMHRYAINEHGSKARVTGICNDIIETIEYDDPDLYIMGIQYHPEIREQDYKILVKLREEAEKRKK